MATGKHFPGHGDTSTDSHLALPYVDHSLKRIENFELVPFRSFIDDGHACMMVGHLAVKALDDSNTPASLSPAIVEGKLKGDLGFGGLIFTDGLAMKGVSSEPDMCIRALEAGNDILLGPANTTKEVKALIAAAEEGRISMELIEEKVLKVLRYKYIAGLASKPQTIDPTVIPARLNTEETKILNRRLHAEAITLLKNHHNIIPLTRLDEKQVGVVSIGSNACRGSFAQMMRRYDGVTVAVCPDKSKVDNTRTKVSGCNLLVVAVSSTKEADAELARAVCKGKRYILAFFTSPYTMSLYKDLIKDAEAVVLGYENTQLAGEATAEVIYGGLPAMGSLSVSVPDLYKVGAGLHTSKIRMGYRLPEEEGLSSQKLDKIETIVNEGLNEGAFPGCQIVIVKGGNVVYNRAFGSIDQDTAHRVTEETLYDLASVTKAMATVPAVMLMRDARKLELGTKLSSLIPALAARHDKKPLTVREALFHETGLPASYPFYKLTAGMTSDTLSERCSLPVARGIFIDPAFRDTMTQKIASLTLKNRGSYLYSDLNFILLRQAVEKASGKPIDQLLAAELYRPLGAWSVGFNPTLRSDSLTIAPTEDDKTVRRQLLCGYVHDEAAAFSGGVEGNAGLFANANDLAKVAEMWLEGGEYGGERFFSPETVKLFTQTKSPKSRRGLGFDKPNMSDSRLSPTCRQAPGSTFGHTGFTGTCFWVDPDNDMAYIFLCNRVYPTRNNPRLVAGNYRTRIQEVIYEAMNQK
jgi:CubicO group peptidase (beta-lactamase class C family)